MRRIACWLTKFGVTAATMTLVVLPANSADGSAAEARPALPCITVFDLSLLCGPATTTTTAAPAANTTEVLGTDLPLTPCGLDLVIVVIGATTACPPVAVVSLGGAVTTTLASTAPVVGPGPIVMTNPTAPATATPSTATPSTATPSTAIAVDLPTIWPGAAIGGAGHSAEPSANCGVCGRGAGATASAADTPTPAETSAGAPPAAAPAAADPATASTKTSTNPPAAASTLAPTNVDADSLPTPQTLPVISSSTGGGNLPLTGISMVVLAVAGAAMLHWGVAAKLLTARKLRHNPAVRAVGTRPVTAGAT